jgi:hypothetical protein
VRNRGSRYAKRVLSTGAPRAAATGPAQRLAATPAIAGTGAPAIRSALALAALALAALALLAPSHASADTRHPAQSISFGTSGNPGSTFNEEIKSIAYDNVHHRLYVLTSYEGERGRIYGYSNPSPGVFTPMPNFPVVVPLVYFNPQIAVDNSHGPTSGRIYYLLQWTYQQHLYAFEPDGSEVGGSFPIDFGEGYALNTNLCGLTTDAESNIWLSVNFQNRLYKYSSSGVQLEEVPLDIHSPCGLAFDESTDDLFVTEGGEREPTWRFTAASGYETKTGPIGSASRGVAVDSKTHLIYTPRSYRGNAGAYTTDGRRIEYIGEGFGARYDSATVDQDTGEVLLADNNNNNVIRVFPPVVVPNVTTGPQQGNDEVVGSVDRAGAGEITQCFFEYATDAYYNANDETYDQQQPCAPPAPFNEDRAVSAQIPGLTNETLYHYRLVAGNAAGNGAGADHLLEPHAVNSLRTEAPTAITRESATLNASFSGNGEDTTYHFQWGVGSVTEHESAPVTLTAPSGHTAISEPITGLTAGTAYKARVIAENEAGETSTAQPVAFETAPAVTALETAAATEVLPNSATLNGSLDPDGLATQYYFEYGKSTTYGQTIPAPPGETLATTTPGSTGVSLPLDGLEGGVTYHFRLVASNSFGVTKGADRSFTTPQKPSISSFASRNVTADSAELTGQINPNGFATTYYFEYGTTLDYGSIAPVPAGQLPAEDGIVNVAVPISGLQGVTYQFRLVAVNKWGETKTENQTLDFFAPAGCPNHALRQQTGAAYLPDCRAYELVSARRAGGALLQPGGPVAPYATSPARFAYVGLINAIPGTGEVGNGGVGDLYVASRTNNGWTTRYVGIPGYLSLGYSGPPDESNFNLLASIPTDLQMNRLLLWDRKSNGFTTGNPLQGSTAPFMYDNEGNELRQLPTNVTEIPNATRDIVEGGFKGTGKPSADLSHYFFSTQDLAFAPGGVVGAPGSAYDNDIAAETVTLISKTESGQDIPRDSAGTAREYIKFPAVSRDGSHVLMSTEAGGGLTHLYMAVNAGGGQYEHFEVSEGDDDTNHGVNFAGMTSDGSRVDFTSQAQLTPDDTDSTTDLFMWSEAGNTVTRISGSGTGGNATNCGASTCDIALLNVGPPSHNKNMDSTYASESGDFYFLSAEQLDGALGQRGKKNLYVYRNGAIQFVTTFENSTVPTRMNVSPNGQHMALLSKARLTSFENAGFPQMYVYDPVSREINCASCPSDGSRPTSPVEASQNGLFMTGDGRVFFATKTSLVPRDANGIKDVYEFVAGRPQLISPGTGDNEGGGEFGIGLVSVSLDGTDVYFSTTSTLVPEDENGEFIKFYDARTNGGFAYQKPALPCAAADECHGAESGPSPASVIGSGAPLGGSGNVKPGKHHARRKHCRKRSKKKCHTKHRGTRQGSKRG